ncbi:family 43 glycosylhydrolase [Paenibacillus mucilaginosus]|nr:family 43 glycosylhydrolase [Paenibacillus mucilaginosus]
MMVQNDGRWMKRTAICMLLAALMGGYAEGASAAAVQYTNPLVAQRADPQIYKHTDGYYYFTATVPEYDRIELRRATTIQGLASAAPVVIWRKHASGEMGAHIWAPEIHYVGGKWYVYFTAGKAEDKWAIRQYALESSDANPLTGTWTEKGKVVMNWDSFTLDGTTFEHNGSRYFVWAQKDPAIAGNSNIYIAKMSSPTTITGTQVLIAKPDYTWEKQGGVWVNEGPAVIKKNGKIFITYSASATDANYCLGLLTASDTSNLLDPKSWVKSAQPVFTSSDATGQYGPGHNSFTVSEDGKSDILVYHDRSYKDISGDPLNDPNRRTRVQKLYWNTDGTPNFGIPVPDGLTPVRFLSYNFPSYSIRHWEYRAKLEPNVTKLADSQFRVVTGLAGSGTVSLESTNFPGYYLRSRNGEVWVEKNDGTALFKQEATFYPRAGLAGTGQSYESYAAPGRYLRHYNYLMYVQPVSTATDKADATFQQD